MADLSYFKRIMLHYFEQALGGLDTDSILEIGDACDTITGALKDQQKEITALRDEMRALKAEAGR